MQRKPTGTAEREDLANPQYRRSCNWHHQPKCFWREKCRPDHGGRRLLGIVLFGFWLLSAGLLHAAELTLAWDANPEDDLAGYTIHWGTQSRAYDHSVELGLETHYTVSGLQEEVTYYFAVTARDSAGNESEYSEELAYRVPVVDSDNDAMADSWEMQYFACLDCDGSGDWDGDGLNDLAEYDLGCDPTCNDSDADGMPDGWEVSCGLDPLNDDAAADDDQDGYSNLREYRAGSLADDAASVPAAEKQMPWLPLLLLE